MNKPIIFFDIESATRQDKPNPALDSIICLGAVRKDPNGEEGTMKQLFNPGFTMSAENMAIHGITNEMVANEPTFDSKAPSILQWFSGCDLIGFNHSNYDIPLLWEEFYRCGVTWDLSGCRVIDVGTIFKLKEARTLSAAVEFYCKRKHMSAHDAMGDVLATMDVYDAQLERYQDLKAMTLDQLHEFSKGDQKRVDLAGKIVLNKDGEPCYNIGKAKGTRVVDDPGFADWIMQRDFSEETKLCLRRILKWGEFDQESPISDTIVPWEGQE